MAVSSPSLFSADALSHASSSAGRAFAPALSKSSGSCPARLCVPAGRREAVMVREKRFERELLPPCGYCGRRWEGLAGRKKHGAARAAIAEMQDVGPSLPDLASLKSELLRRIAGLDRGLVATEEDAEEVDAASRALERNGKSVELPEDLPLLQGRWRLIYSSGFLSGSLGGQRPGPPVGRLPITLGQVYQRIDMTSLELDNIVTLQLGTPWPLPSVEVTATLAHTFETFAKAGIRIVFERTSVKWEGALKGLPPLNVPQLPEFLRPPSGLRSGEFETTFLEEDLRVSRGDRGELRIFVKA